MTSHWTKDDHFRFDIALGLMKARVRGARRRFTEEERERIARTIVEHLRRSRWNWWREEGSVGPGYMARMPSELMVRRAMMDLTRKRDELVGHLEAALALADEVGDSVTGYLIETALD